MLLVWLYLTLHSGICEQSLTVFNNDSPQWCLWAEFDYIWQWLTSGVCKRFDCIWQWLTTVVSVSRVWLYLTMTHHSGVCEQSLTVFDNDLPWWCVSRFDCFWQWLTTVVSEQSLTVFDNDSPQWCLWAEFDCIWQWLTTVVSVSRVWLYLTMTYHGGVCEQSEHVVNIATHTTQLVQEPVTLPRRQVHQAITSSWNTTTIYHSFLSLFR